MMEQKRVSFEIAKAIKEAGYPQDYKNAEDTYTNLNGGIWVKPTYLDVWFWLWKEKKFFIKIMPAGNTFHFQILDHQYDEWHSWGILSKTGYDSPEDAIIGGVDYMVDNDLLK